MSRIVVQAAHLHEGLQINYLRDTVSGVIGLQIYPAAASDRLTERRDKFRLALGFDVDAWQLQPLVGLHLAGERAAGSFTQGRTLQHSPSAKKLVWQDQTFGTNAGCTRIVTRLATANGALEVEHSAELVPGVPALACRSRVRNRGEKAFTLQLLTSCTLAALSPFAADDAPGRLKLHRFRSSWSQEGRHVADSFEHLHLEPSWTRWDPLSERFGQVGSMPARSFFPLAAIEDAVEGVFWATQLAWLGSWQIEAMRWGESAGLAAGLADFEFGHSQKTLAPGEEFESPAGFLTSGRATLDDICETLLQVQRRYATPPPPSEHDLPIVFNEYCTTWGKPTEASMLDIAARLKGTPIKYVVIDAGWSEKEEHYSDQQSNGDWEIKPSRFPRGFAHLNATIRAQGQIPGIWFEFEVCTEGAKAYLLTDHHLHRDGRVLEVGVRRYWDFRDPWVIDYLSEKLIAFLRREGFGYLKVDYNDTIGLGCDSPDGLGEGLRQHLVAVHRFFEKMRHELPDLVIENCASGGHRLEPLMVGTTSMSSFSDAHEGEEIPWIAANLQRLIPPEKSQIWAVLRPGDTSQRLSYTLTAGFLGRLCLSGDIATLAPEQWALAQEAMALYRKIWPVIQGGTSRRFGPDQLSVRHLRDYQVIRRVSHDGRSILIVWHTFELAAPATAEIPLPPGNWQAANSFNALAGTRLDGSTLHLPLASSFAGGVVHLDPAG